MALLWLISQAATDEDAGSRRGGLCHTAPQSQFINLEVLPLLPERRWHSIDLKLISIDLN